ncbi:unnamed protein product, partial [Closterium sp. NIES-54]
DCKHQGAFSTQGQGQWQGHAVRVRVCGEGRGGGEVDWRRVEGSGRRETGIASIKAPPARKAKDNGNGML